MLHALRVVDTPVITYRRGSFHQSVHWTGVRFLCEANIPCITDERHLVRTGLEAVVADLIFQRLALQGLHVGIRVEGDLCACARGGDDSEFWVSIICRHKLGVSSRAIRAIKRRDVSVNYTLEAV